MSHAAAPGETAGDPGRYGLLDRIGRAGTPGVDEFTFTVDELHLTGHDLPAPATGEHASDEVVLVVATAALRVAIGAGHRVLEAAPSLAVAQDARLRSDRMVVELDAFAAGPWAGTDAPHRAAVLHDLAAAAARVRTRGGVVYVLPHVDGREDTTRLPGNRVGPDLIPADTEGAPPSRLVRTLLDHQANARRRRADEGGHRGHAA